MPLRKEKINTIWYSNFPVMILGNLGIIQGFYTIQSRALSLCNKGKIAKFPVFSLFIREFMKYLTTPGFNPGASSLL